MRLLSILFYLTFPYERFAHLTANSVTQKSVLQDAQIVHKVHNDLGKGVQRPPVVEALRLTSIK